MKNKHIVGLFLTVLILGWGISRLDFGQGTSLNALLVKAAPSDIKRIAVFQMNDTLRLLRTPYGWLSSGPDENTPFPDSAAEKMLDVICHLETIRFLKTGRPDTLGLPPERGIALVYTSAKMPESETFFLGKTIVENGLPATWLAVANHNQFYLVKGDIVSIFNQRWTSAHPGKFYTSDTTSTDSICLFFPGDSAVLRHADKGYDMLKNWLNAWQQTADGALEFRFFDKKEYGEAPAVELIFHQPEHEPESCALYFLSSPDLPDDPERRREFRDYAPRYILESSRYPGMFFGIPDTFAVGRLLRKDNGLK